MRGPAGCAGSWPRPGESITSLESCGVCTRRQTRRLVLARMFSLTAPDGRWVASIMCTPRLRPRWAIPTSDGDEVGQLGGQRGELVDDHQQPRQRLRTPARPRDEPVVLDEIGGAVLAQHALAVAQLGLQRAQRALAEVLVEVGDHPDGVRQLRALAERAAALVVDQHEVDRAAASGAAASDGDQAAQQLALAGAGRAGDQAVRPVADEVDVERTVLGEREPRQQAGLAARWTAHRRRRSLAVGLAASPAARAARRRPAARRRRAAGRRPRTAPAPPRRRARSAPTSRRRAAGRSAGRAGGAEPRLAGLVGELDHGRARRGQPLAGAREDDPADLLTGAQQRPAGRAAALDQRRAVEHRQHLARIVGVAVGQLGGQRRAGGGADRQLASGRAAGVAGVGQPLDPVPVLAAPRAR